MTQYTVAMAAQRELLERIENESKAHGSDLGSQNLPTCLKIATAVRSLASQYVLLPFSLRPYCASTSFMSLFALIFRPKCAATETVALIIMSKVLFRRFQKLHNAFMSRFNFRLNFSTLSHCSRQSANPLRSF